EIEGVDQHVDCLLIDLNGRILLEEETENGVLDVSQVNSGIYILQLHDDRGSSSHKVIVQH
ncbi:MAG: T9SS type A sorting domain-containing protein, partial [Flavobacteriia bacterium]|nr:T9SS type A sorting domain-containing protein [Flavobacteriia bacterium]